MKKNIQKVIFSNRILYFFILYLSNSTIYITSFNATKNHKKRNRYPNKKWPLTIFFPIIILNKILSPIHIHTHTHKFFFSRKREQRNQKKGIYNRLDDSASRFQTSFHVIYDEIMPAISHYHTHASLGKRFSPSPRPFRGHFSADITAELFSFPPISIGRVQPRGRRFLSYLSTTLRFSSRKRLLFEPKGLARVALSNVGDSLLPSIETISRKVDGSSSHF